MSQRTVLIVALVAALALLAAGCSDLTTPTRAASNGSGHVHVQRPTATQPAATRVAAQPVSAQPSPAMQTPVPQTPEKATIAVWWPDELYPDADDNALILLENQLELFQLTYSSYDLDLRRKRTHGLGGILPTLRTATPVAPGALPHLTLMRRTDMITAAKEGLIVPIGAWIPTDLAGANLFPGVRALGEFNGELYGVPYALTFLHAIYRPSVFEAPPVTFDDVLAAETPYAFAGGATPVNWTLLLQYIAAEGQLVDASGSAVLNAEALLNVLAYYDRGADAGIFAPELLEYQATADYWNAFVTGEANMISVDSQTYLSLKSDVENAGLAPVPSLTGLPLTMLDGWMWVITTQNPDYQQRALAFLSWMMRVSQHAAFSESMGVVPSQIRALRLWDDTDYADFAQELIGTAIVFPEERRNNASAVALQEAFSAVLRGTSPETAANDALSRLE